MSMAIIVILGAVNSHPRSFLICAAVITFFIPALYHNRGELSKFGLK